MPTNTNVENLKINQLTEAQYDAAIQQGIIGANEISIITDLSDTIQVDELPEASSDNLGDIVQFVGATSGSYTNGYFYKCVATASGAATGPGTVEVIDSYKEDGQTPIVTVSDVEGLAHFCCMQNGEPVASIVKFVYSPEGYSDEMVYYNLTTGETDSAEFREDEDTYANYMLIDWLPGTTSGGDYVTIKYTPGAAELTYAWNRVDVQPAPVIPDPLPDQTGNAGKFLTTDGTDASWSDSVPKINIDTPTRHSFIKTGDGATWFSLFSYSGTTEVQPWGSFYFHGSSSTWVLGSNSSGVARSYAFNPSELHSYGNCNLGSSEYKWLTTYTTKINNGADIAVPTTGGTMSVQVSSLPTAAATLEGQIYQFTGATDSTYTNGRFYKCVSDGQNPATYSWEEVSMGGGSLPSQTGQSGKFLTTDGTDASWSDKPLVNTATGSNSLGVLSSSTASNSVSIGSGVTTANYGPVVVIGKSANGGQESVCIGSTAKTSRGSVALGNFAQATGEHAVAIGSVDASWNAVKATANYAIQLGGSNKTNSDANTFKVANANGNFEIMSADGTIPTARLMKVNSTITLAAADWSSNTQTVNVTGMTATGIVFASPDPTYQSAYTSAGILCTAQAAGTLTFTCTTTPSSNINVNIVML